MDGWMSEWVDEWVDGLVGGKASLRIAYSNQQIVVTFNNTHERQLLKTQLIFVVWYDIMTRKKYIITHKTNGKLF